MRFKSKKSGGFQVFAVTGVNTVSFGISATTAARAGLLGFAVERVDPQNGERYTMPGFKVFESIIPHPDENQQVSTWDHPVQSFVWDDFTGKPDHEYEYVFHPLRGAPKNLDRSAPPISIQVRTEPLFSDLEHDVFFNRGVASSQAYRRRFDNITPDKLSPEKKEEALQWLTRELDDAILKFIRQAKKNDTLLCCFYEFRYRPVADELKAALDRGVDVRIILDAKVNESTDKDGKFHESFPREDNLEMVKAVKIPKDNVIRREAKPNDISHNKFMVWLKGSQQKPAAVWTGSTNISLGGLSGQTNVGHWVRNEKVADLYRQYWDLLSSDPGPKKGAAKAVVTKENAALRKAVGAIAEVPTAIDDVPKGVLPVFSPRAGKQVLEMYCTMIDKAPTLGCITLAFGINKAFKAMLKDNTKNSGLVFMLLEKEDRPNAKSKEPFISINASHNVYKAWGSFLRDAVYQWAKETNAKALGLNQHVSYVHSKFLLMEPLSKDPIVVTGSANFSDASTNDNDENMLIIRGDRRVADIYFTEFNRLFNHYYFRAVTESLQKQKKNDAGSLFLAEKAEDWLMKYKPGTLRTKRVRMYERLEGFTTL